METRPHRHVRVAALSIACLLAATLPFSDLGAGTVQTRFYAYNGTDGTDGSVRTWRIPAGVSQIDVTVDGAAGSRNGFQSVGGLGARVRATIAVTPGEVLRIRVGGRPMFNNPAALGGYNGGGPPNVMGFPRSIIPGGGGGGSDIRRGGGLLHHRIVVAGGGGGAGAPASQNAQGTALPGSGGEGGGSGENGGAGGLIGPLFDASQGGWPGLADSGGLGGQPGFSSGMCGFEGLPGQLGLGGGGLGGINYSGGGGGGLYGGGSGASGPCEFTDSDYVGGAGGGGGGSSLVPEGGTLSEAVREGHGRIVIRYTLP